MISLDTIYRAGISTSKYHFVINPLRYILFRFLKPYLNAIVNELTDKNVYRSEQMDNLALQIEMRALKNRLNTIESILSDKYSKEL